MDNDYKNFCCGCLCSGRTMIRLEGDRKNQCFLQIIGDISPSTTDLDINLCYECNKLLEQFTKFVEQVKASYTLFWDCVKQKKDLSNIAKTHIANHSIQDLNIIAKDDSIVHLKDQIDLPKDSVDQDTIKEEYDNYIDSNHSDNKKTVELLEKTSRPKNKKCKKKINQDTVKAEFENDIDSNFDEKTVKKTSRLKKKKFKKKAEVFKEITLNDDELNEERNVIMSSDDYVNAVYKCDKCLVSFPNSEDLDDHVKLKHELHASLYKCTICLCSFSSETSYYYHTNKHRRRYECVVCCDRFNSKRNVLRHFEFTHYHGPPIEFDVKDTKYENGHKLDDIEEIKDGSTYQSAESFPCEFCAKTFRWKTSLRKHLETHRIESGQKRKPYCEPCRLSFTTTSNLQKHVKTSSKHQIQLKLRKLTESNPPQPPVDHQARVEKIRSSVNTSRERYPCAQCDKKFQWRGNLIRHVNSHVARANGELVCEPCNKTFSSIATYQQHMKISKKHVSESDFKYVCSDCGKKFANKTRLKDHVDWEHLKNYVHVCDVCQKVFKSHTSLYLHKQVVHKKDNAEHLCDHCGKPFPNHAKLRSHITALHSLESAYKCDICGARFSWHSCLSRHARKVHRTKISA